MPLQNYVDRVGPVILSAWLNAVDIIKFTIFADATTKAQARAALTSDGPFLVGQGGSGLTTGATLLFPGTATGTANAVVVTLLGPITTFVRNTGVRVGFTASAVNTTAATLNVDGTGAAAILNQLGSACTGGELFLPVIVQWTGAAWKIVEGGILPTLARNAAEIAAAVTPVNYTYPAGLAERYGYIADGTDGADTGTDNATAISNCILSNTVSVFPTGVGRFSGSITLPVGKTIMGQGPRATMLRQAASGTTAAIILGDITSSDISEGSHRILDMCIKPAAHGDAHGIRIGDGATAVNASMLDFRNLRIWSQQQEIDPVVPISPQRGIYIQSASSAVFLAPLRLVEIRCFHIGIDSNGSAVSANEWAFQSCWLLDCRVGVNLTNCSTWNLSGITVESAVSNAICLQTSSAVSNILWQGGRWELTATGGFGIAGDGSTTGQNWRFSGITVLINGDASAVPGRKWTGTLPNDFVFSGYTSTAPFMVIPNADQTHQMPQRMIMGGSGLGNARLKLGRNSGGTEITLEHDGTQTIFTASEELRILVENGAKVAGRFDGSTTAGQTRLLIFDVDNNTLERVTVGVADSGGVGFKLLRIPN